MQPPHVSAQDGVRSDLLKAIRDGKKIGPFSVLFFCTNVRFPPESSEIYVSIHSQLFWQGRKKSFVSRRTTFPISISRKKIIPFSGIALKKVEQREKAKKEEVNIKRLLTV